PESTGSGQVDRGARIVGEPDTARVPCCWELDFDQVPCPGNDDQSLNAAIVMLHVKSGRLLIAEVASFSRANADHSARLAHTEECGLYRADIFGLQPFVGGGATFRFFDGLHTVE